MSGELNLLDVVGKKHQKNNFRLKQIDQRITDEQSYIGSSEICTETKKRT